MHGIVSAGESIDVMADVAEDHRRRNPALAQAVGLDRPPQPVQPPAVLLEAGPRAPSVAALADESDGRADGKRVGEELGDPAVSDIEAVEVDASAVMGDLEVDRPDRVTVPLRAQGVLDGVGVPGQIRVVRERLLANPLTSDQKRHLVEGAHRPRRRGRLADELDAITEPSDPAPFRVNAAGAEYGPSAVDERVGRGEEAIGRVQEHVLVDERDHRCRGLCSAVVERCARRGKGVVGVVDRISSTAGRHEPAMRAGTRRASRGRCRR